MSEEKEPIEEQDTEWEVEEDKNHTMTENVKVKFTKEDK